MATDTTTAGQINTVIDHLADKLRVPATELWSILLTQAWVECVKGLIAFGGIVTLMVLAIRFLAPRIVPKDGEDWFDQNPFLFIGGLCAMIFLGIGLLITGGQAIDAIGYALNPRYFALHEVLSAIH